MTEFLEHDRFHNIEIDYEKNILIKCIPSEEVANEVKVTVNACAIAEKSNLFKVPEVIDFNISEGWIHLNYFPNMVPIWAKLHSDHWEPIITKIGESLSYIHKYLKCNDADKKEFIKINDYLLSEPETQNVFFHGDFTMSNVQFDKQDQQLVIIDWSFYPQLKVQYNYGPAYWDLVIFILTVFTDIRPDFNLNNSKKEELAKRFIASYWLNAGNDLSINELFYFSKKIFLLLIITHLKTQGIKSLIRHFFKFIAFYHFWRKKNLAELTNLN